MTALATHLRQVIRREGAITVARFMSETLGHPEHGYYMTRDPFGAGGDFITAPEVSQMFGELIGLWVAAVWQALGGPKKLSLIELGPGRGTLMADALRAVKTVPKLSSALDVHLVDMSPALRAIQQRALAQAGAFWHQRLEDALAAAGDAPTVVIANEFFDALPIHQLIRSDEGWRQRLVGLDAEERFAFQLDNNPTGLAAMIPPALTDVPMGSVVELSPASLNLVGELARHVLRGGGAALIIDYGHSAPGAGDTLQAVKGHGYVDIFETPGEADLTAHVDFTALATVARQQGAAVFGPIEQRRFLEALGLRLRAERLAAATPERAAEIWSAHRRLTAEDAMGTLFKALAIARPGMAIPGFSA